MMQTLTNFINEFLSLTARMAPWLLPFIPFLGRQACMIEIAIFLICDFKFLIYPLGEFLRMLSIAHVDDRTAGYFR